MPTRGGQKKNKKGKSKAAEDVSTGGELVVAEPSTATSLVPTRSAENTRFFAHGSMFTPGAKTNVLVMTTWVVEDPISAPSIVTPVAVLFVRNSKNANPRRDAENQEATGVFLKQLKAQKESFWSTRFRESRSRQFFDTETSRSNMVKSVEENMTTAISKLMDSTPEWKNKLRMEYVDQVHSGQFLARHDNGQESDWDTWNPNQITSVKGQAFENTTQLQVESSTGNSS